MIIIITDHGNKYVNDSSIELLSHEREERKVHIFLADRNVSAYDYKDVQQVVYIGNNSDVTFKEDSDVVADLKKLLKEEEARYDDLLKNSAMMRTYALKLMKCDPELYDKINEEVHQEFKDYLNNKRNEQANKSKPGD
jgi:hypothetical protein